MKREELYHHGILGQKWGKRQGPPYPLSESDHSASEKKAGWKRSLDDQSDSKKLRVNRRYALGLDVKNENEFRKELFRKNSNVAMVNPSIIDWAKNHKKQILTGVVAISAVAAIAAGRAYFIKNKNINISELKKVNPENAINSNDLLNTPLNKILSGTKYSTNYNFSEVDASELANSGFGTKQERFLKSWLIADMHRFDPISAEEFSKMTNNDAINLEAGAKMFRLSKGSHNTLRSGFEYVSINDDDRGRYLGFLPKMWAVNGKERIDKVFETELSAKTTIRAPGKKESIEIMITALRRGYPGHTDAEYRADVLNHFYQYQANLADRNNRLGKLYAETLLAHGYNAMIDYNDAGRLSNKPLILINGAQTASVEAINRYSSDEINQAFQNLKLPSNIQNFKASDWEKEPRRILADYDGYLKEFLK